MFSFFGLGLLLGIQHAMEADHVAAVAALTRRGVTVRQASTFSALWGLGHGATLMVFGGMVLLLDVQLSESLARWLEFAVGGMLLILGIKVMIGILRERIHIHPHRHKSGVMHVHVHSHVHETLKEHSQSIHDHSDAKSTKGQIVQSLFIGVMHGMAGTAALIVFMVATTMDSVLQGIGYIAIFGLGSLLGMAVLSVVVSYPASLIERKMAALGIFLRFSMGVATTVIGCTIIITIWV